MVATGGEALDCAFDSLLADDYRSRGIRSKGFPPSEEDSTDENLLNGVTLPASF